MASYIIGIVRSATRLEALTYEARGPVDRLAPWRIEHVCELRPLTPEVRPELWRAWHALAAVDTWDATTLAHVRRVLRDTVPSIDDGGDLPALGDDVHPPDPPKATAAHPRVHRGTYLRPPRPQQPASVDVRAYLLARRHIDQVLAQLDVAPHVDAAAGYDPAFVMQLWPLFAGATAGEIGAFAALVSAFALSLSPVLRGALVAVYRAAADPGRALGWWSHVLAQEPMHRVQAAQLVSATGVAAIDPIAPELATSIAALDASAQWSIYRALARGATPAYLLSGLELGAISQTKLEELAPGQRDATEILVATVDRLGAAMDEDSGAEFWLTYLWTMCGHQPELVDVLARPDFVGLEPSAAFQLLRMACIPRWWIERAAALWAALAPTLPRLIAITTTIARAYQGRFVEELAGAYHGAVDTRHEPHAVEVALDLCRRVARPPFDTDAVLDAVISNVASVDVGLRGGLAVLCEAPDASWLALEAACKRLNDARLIARGLHRLVVHAPGLLTVFATAPGAVIRTAAALSSVSVEEAADVLQRFHASSLASPDVANAPIEQLCALVEPIARAGGPDPIRRALRRHLAGEVVLGASQLAGHRGRIVAELGPLRLAAIRGAVEARLAAKIGSTRIESPTMRHALGMLQHVERHRRQLRRILRSTLRGDPSRKLHHPAADAWFARHPRVDRAIWSAGIETRGEVAGAGDVRISVEHDPLEALKLGTYVGSCLGRGGGLEYSAAAVVLDANKHVVYVRDARGAVIGRQLVAISEDDELVCFAVYGTAKRALLEPLLLAFDQAFAAALGLPLYAHPRDPADAYVIENILSYEWWDDDAWTG